MMTYVMSRLGYGLPACTLLIAVGFVLSWPGIPLNAVTRDRKEPKLKQLLKERVAVLRTIADRVTQSYKSGDTTAAKLYEANLMVLQAELELCETDRERLAVLEKILKGAKEYEEETAQGIKQGREPTFTALRAKVERLNAEIALERLRLKIEAGGK